jgi:uncharacterized protein YbaR (Trm112 family)/SAM-dependent methyltransferase
VGSMKLSPELQTQLCCPVCRSSLQLNGDQLRCLDPNCGKTYPIVDGIPVLINDAESLFSIEDVLRESRNANPRPPKSKLLKFAAQLVPSISSNVNADQNYASFGKALLAMTDSPRVLVVGSGLLGAGIDKLLSLSSRIQIVESDIGIRPRVVLVCDAHSIPIKDKVFDGVVVQAVLEHVADPHRCVEEIHRVLNSNGIVYAETPFIQQVHGGPYDFSRFTHLGHRRLFRKFDEVESGVACGPGMALAWSYLYFLQSFAGSRFSRRVLQTFGRFTSFYLTYFDRFLAAKAGAFDAASGFYFIGRKTGRTLSDRELVQLYRGAIPVSMRN